MPLQICISGSFIILLCFCDKFFKYYFLAIGEM